VVIRVHEDFALGYPPSVFDQLFVYSGLPGRGADSDEELEKQLGNLGF